MKSGHLTLNLHYRMNLGSQGFQVTLSLTPEGERLAVTLTGGAGTVTAVGTGGRR